MEQMTLAPHDDTAPWRVEHCGGVYEIKYDSGRVGIHPPSWYVQRMNDLAESKRYYSRPEGAFGALRQGAIVWE